MHSVCLKVPRTDIDETADRSPRIKSVLFDLGAWMAPRPEAEPFEATRQTGVCVVDMEHPSAPRSLTPPRTGSMLG
jgi:hypothetical protein